MNDADLIARSAERGRPVAVPESDPLARFVAGACRAIGAAAGCVILEADRDAGDPPSIQGCVAVDPAADTALEALLVATATGRHAAMGWTRSPAAPGHVALLSRIASPECAGELLLVFAAATLAADGAAERVQAIAAGLAIAAGAMVEAWADRAALADDQLLLAAALNQSECGIIIVRADHSVLFSNGAAEAILTARDGMELRRNQLRPTRYQDAIRFQAALDHILTLPPSARKPSDQSMMMLLSRSDAARQLIAVIAPIAAGTADRDAVAIVYVMRPEFGGLRGVEAICHLHALSPVETQLVAQLVAGATLAEAAAEMRIKPDTARTYLKQAFAKTDTHRQADLIQLILRYQRAVRGDFVFHAA